MTGSSKIVPDRPDLDRHLSEDTGFQTAFLRCLAAIATADGTVSLSEYGALNQIAGQIEQSAFAAHALLWFLEHPSDLSAALVGAWPRQHRRGSRYDAGGIQGRATPAHASGGR